MICEKYTQLYVCVRLLSCSQEPVYIQAVLQDINYQAWSTGMRFRPCWVKQHVYIKFTDVRSSGQRILLINWVLCCVKSCCCLNGHSLENNRSAVIDLLFCKEFVYFISSVWVRQLTSAMWGFLQYRWLGLVSGHPIHTCVSLSVSPVW